MAKAKKTKHNPVDDFINDLQDSMSKESNNTIHIMESSDNNIKEIIKSEVIPEEEKTNIDEELQKFENNIVQINLVLDSINPLSIIDIEERAKILKLKMDILYKLPPLLASLDNLREKKKIKDSQIKGNKDLSPLEDGSLD